MVAFTGVLDKVKRGLAKPDVVLKPGTVAAADALVAQCREHLAADKIPRAVQFVDEVPITASGKIMGRLLKNFDDGTC